MAFVEGTSWLLSLAKASSENIITSDKLRPVLVNDTFIKALPMDENRIKYLEFHHSSVFKGTLDNT